MEQNFSLKRALLLFKLMFINYVSNPFFKRARIMLIAIIVIASVGSIVGAFNFINPISVLMSFVFTTMFGLLVTLHGYEQYRDKLNVCTSHMLPASVNEKFFIPLFTSLILIVGMLSVVYVIWSLLQLVVGESGSFDTIITNILNNFSIISLFIGLLFIHSLCCLCSVLFKNGAANGATITLVPLPMIFLNVRMSRSRSEDIPYLLSLPPSFWYCSMIILSLLFWFAAYTIFRKRQLNK